MQAIYQATKEDIHVAGTSFPNDATDGGESRQEILKHLPDIISLTVIHTTFDGEPALKLREKNTRKVIGWVPKGHIGTFWNTKEVTGIIRVKDDNYGCVIDAVIPPTKAMYSLAMTICQKHGLEKPAYDQRAYQAAFRGWRRQGYLK